MEPTTMPTATTFNLSTRTTGNGRIAGMSSRSPLNRTVDATIALGNAQELAALAAAIAERITEAEADRAAALRKFNRTNTRNAGNALRNADIALAALTAAARRLA